MRAEGRTIPGQDHSSPHLQGAGVEWTAAKPTPLPSSTSLLHPFGTGGLLKRDQETRSHIKEINLDPRSSYSFQFGMRTAVSNA